MEISDNRYQELLAAESDVKRLKSDAENTATALKVGREEKQALKDQIAAFETEKKDLEAKIAEKDTTLTEKETELTSAKEIADKWEQSQQAEKQAKLDAIEKMKTDLWDKFDDNVKNFIDGLPEDKVESYLKGLLPSDQNPPVTTDGNKGDNPWWKDPSAFDAALKSWNINDALSALDNI